MLTKCGCIGLEALIVIFIIALIKRRQIKWKRGHMICIGSLMSLTLVLFSGACGRITSAEEDNNALKSQKSEIVRKINILLADLDKLEPRTIRTIYEILDKLDLRGGKPKAILANLVAVGFPSTGISISGQHLEAWFESGDWDNIQIKAVKTPTPYQPGVPWESGRAFVGDSTQGTITLSYTASNRKNVEVKKTIEINNRTMVISCGGSTISPTLLKTIFEPLPSTMGKEIVTVAMDFSYPLTIYVSRE
jgi:hypothetical protein